MQLTKMHGKTPIRSYRLPEPNLSDITLGPKRILSVFAAESHLRIKGATLWSVRDQLRYLCVRIGVLIWRELAKSARRPGTRLCKRALAIHSERLQIHSELTIG